MFEKEIKFINDLTISKLQSFGEFISLEQIKSAGIHPAIVKYIEAEIDYLIYEDRMKLLKNSIFDYSGKTTEGYFTLIAEEIKKSKRFTQDYISKLILHSISFTVNFLIKPNWTITRFLFDSNDEKSTSEIINILSYIYYYDYLKKIVISYLEKKNLQKFSKAQLEELLGKINQLGTETNTIPIIETAVKSISDFMNFYELKKTSININSVQQFLRDKNFSAISEIVEKKYLGATPNTTVEPLEIVSFIQRELENQTQQEELASEIEFIAVEEESVEEVVENGISDEFKSTTEEIMESEDSAESSALEETEEINEAGETLALEEIEVPEDFEELKTNEESSETGDAEITDETEITDEAETESDIQLLNDDTPDEFQNSEEIATPNNNDLNEVFDSPIELERTEQKMEFEEEVIEESELFEDEYAEDEILEFEEIIDAGDEQKISEENEIEEMEQPASAERDEKFVLEKKENDGDSGNFTFFEIEEMIEENRTVESENDLLKDLEDSGVDLDQVSQIDSIEENLEESIKQEDDVIDDPFQELDKSSAALEKLNEEIENSKLSINVPIGSPMTQSSVEIEIKKTEPEEKLELDTEEVVELDDNRTKDFIVEEDFTEEHSFEEDKLKESIMSSLGKEETHTNAIELEMAPEIDIADLLEHKKMTKIIEVVFDYDMEDFTNCIDNICDCKNEEQAEKVIEDLYRQNNVKPTRKEAELFKEIIFEYFKRK